MLITPVHSLVAIARNRWSQSIGTTGRNQSEHVVAITRCAHLTEFADKGVRSFHMSECLAQEGQFARVDKPGINYIITQLSETLGRHIKIRPISSAVIVEDWDAVVTDAEFLKRFPAPVDLCFDDVVRQLANWSKGEAGGERVAPMFAYRQDYSPDLTRIYGADDWYRETLAALAFGYPSDVVPLQAADFVVEQIKHDTDRREYEKFTLATGGITPALRNATPNGEDGHILDADGLGLCVAQFLKTGEIYPVD